MSAKLQSGTPNAKARLQSYLKSYSALLADDEAKQAEEQKQFMEGGGNRQGAMKSAFRKQEMRNKPKKGNNQNDE